MNIYKQLNKLIKYIEDHLEEEINYEEFSKIMGINGYVVDRLFQLLTDVTVREYIRKRKLSKAVSDLINGDKIIDVAVKYQYTNGAAFSRAFYKMHGVKSSDVKKGKVELKLFAPIKFDESLLNNKTYKFEILEKDTFSIYIREKIFQDKIDPRVTKQFWIDKKKEVPSILKQHRRYGIVMNKKDYVSYAIGMNIQFQDSKILVVPRAKWLIVKIEEAGNLGKKSLEFKTHVLPTTGYKIKKDINIEVYYQDHYELWYKI